MSLPENPGDGEIRAILERVRRIAVAGLSPKAHRDSNRVSAYMQRAGYEIVPVYPREETILGARVYRSVCEIEAPVDLVNVFRRSEDLPEVVADILKIPHPNAPPGTSATLACSKSALENTRLSVIFTPPMVRP